MDRGLLNMKKRDIHEMLTVLADMERADLYQDRLSSIIEDTLRMADEESELLDDELEEIAAARKSEDYDEKDLFD